MKYSLALLFSIFSFSCANSPFEQHQNNYDPNGEIDRLWNKQQEESSKAGDRSQEPSNKGILADEILTAKRDTLDPELAEFVINMCGKETEELAREIQECVKNPNKVCPERILLVGAPGIGKTTYVQAIAQKAHIPLLVINCAFVTDKYKDSGPVNLHLIFESFLKTTSKIIVAFDELQCLTDGHKNSNDPNPKTDTALWQLMDQCKRNPHIIFIGIMNDASKMPEPIKSRFEGFIYYMKPTNDIAQKQKIINYYLNKFKHNCDEKCLKVIARLLKTAEARKIETIVSVANRKARLGKEVWQITQKDLQDAIEKTEETSKVMESKKETIPARELNNWEKSGIAAAIFGCIGAGINNIDKTAQRHGGWKKIWEEKIAPVVKVFAR